MRGPPKPSVVPHTSGTRCTIQLLELRLPMTRPSQFSSRSKGHKLDRRTVLQVPRAAGAIVIAPAVDTLLTALQRELQISGRRKLFI
jgi:hypothetical protein